MSASSPNDGRPTALPSLPEQAALSPVATPAGVAGESTLGADIASAKGDSPPSERHAMSFEEFRRHYVASRRSNYLSSHGKGMPAHGTDGPDELADEVTEQLDAVGVRRRRIVSASNDTRSAQTAATAAASTPPLAAQAPPALLARVARSIGLFVSWLADRIMRNRAHYLQLLLVFFVLYVHVKLDSAHLVCLILLYVVVKGTQALLQNFHIGHETGTTGAPSLLGRLFKPEGHAGPVSKLRKIGYVVAKCVEAFLLSFFPMYSLEHLERELGTDGIVG
ncbi:hypothetical protein LSCM1_06830 [Leishmania martiniquensis]|uniref:Uncharacterized protein n=1 Tax=Leishmania martiniquensis TaxID=1580590 RepID=A0A836HTU3_9TRYP|nr:hypothetical protein LSCM1_06830 [Leishmania martiniquensis]